MSGKRMVLRGLCAAAALAFTAEGVLANIDLEFRPSHQVATVSQTVDIGLYAVSDSAVNQPMSAVDLVFGWDPSFLDLTGLSQTGAVPLLSSFFPAGDPWGVNEVVPPQDGGGFYSAFAQLGSPVQVTPAGVLLTTFKFTALAETPLTTVGMLSSISCQNTVVFGGSMPNTDVTGTLSHATVEIVPEPGSVLLLFAGVTLLARRRR